MLYLESWSNFHPIFHFVLPLNKPYTTLNIKLQVQILTMNAKDYKNKKSNQTPQSLSLYLNIILISFYCLLYFHLGCSNLGKSEWEICLVNFTQQNILTFYRRQFHLVAYISASDGKKLRMGGLQRERVS
jgi:hypothetical protein